MKAIICLLMMSSSTWCNAEMKLSGDEIGGGSGQHFKLQKLGDGSGRYPNDKTSQDSGGGKVMGESSGTGPLGGDMGGGSK